MTVFLASIIVVILITLLWLVKSLMQIGSEVTHLGHKFDSLISLLERIEHNTQSTSQFLSEEAQAYHSWKDELEGDEPRGAGVRSGHGFESGSGSEAEAVHRAPTVSGR